MKVESEGGGKSNKEINRIVGKEKSNNQIARFYGLKDSKKWKRKKENKFLVQKILRRIIPVKLK